MSSQAQIRLHARVHLCAWTSKLVFDELMSPSMLLLMMMDVMLSEREFHNLGKFSLYWVVIFPLQTLAGKLSAIQSWQNEDFLEEYQPVGIRSESESRSMLIIRLTGEMFLFKLITMITNISRWKTWKMFQCFTIRMVIITHRYRQILRYNQISYLVFIQFNERRDNYRKIPGWSIDSFPTCFRLFIFCLLN